MPGPAPMPPDTPVDMRPLHALLSGIVDYAGLFPPAKLPMDQAVRTYADALRTGESWMLGRLIIPVSRLEEFRKSAAGFLPTRAPGNPGTRGGPDRDAGPMFPDTHEHHADQPWPISALVDGDLDENLDSIFAFNHEHARPDKGLAIIDAVEIKIPSGSGGAVFLDEALDLVPEELFPFFEIPAEADADVRGLVAALSGSDAGAKIRTGGITPEAFPAPERIADFLAACSAADVPFKATAGLHHPVRSEHPLTYDPGCPRGVMHGFLNVFVAAAMLRSRKIDARMAVDVLEEQDPRAFVFGDRDLTYRTVSLESAEIALTRETFALSFGSCSFDEPVSDLRSMGLIT